jgi:hypothetical protein
VYPILVSYRGYAEMKEDSPPGLNGFTTPPTAGAGPP